MREIYPIRKIVKKERYRGFTGCNFGAYKVKLTLSCGHETFRKGSKEPHYTARCQECWLELPRPVPEHGIIKGVTIREDRLFGA